MNIAHDFFKNIITLSSTEQFGEIINLGDKEYTHGKLYIEFSDAVEVRVYTGKTKAECDFLESGSSYAAGVETIEPHYFDFTGGAVNGKIAINLAVDGINFLKISAKGSGTLKAFANFTKR
jgi:hypothetical protein